MLALAEWLGGAYMGGKMKWLLFDPPASWQDNLWHQVRHNANTPHTSQGIFTSLTGPFPAILSVLPSPVLTYPCFCQHTTASPRLRKPSCVSPLIG